MTVLTFQKVLTANDTGETDGHQAGVHIPKSQIELIGMLPVLDAKLKNPDCWLKCVDSDGTEWKFRYVYYNNKLHEERGTRNEYRITHMTKFFRASGATSGDILQISGEEKKGELSLSIQPQKSEVSQVTDPNRISLRGWRKVS